jgi:hypothetical protein
VKEEEFIPGKIAEFIDDPDRWGIVKSVSNCGECVYLQRFGKGAETAIGYSGVSRSLLRVVNAKN